MVYLYLVKVARQRTSTPRWRHSGPRGTPVHCPRVYVRPASSGLEGLGRDAQRLYCTPILDIADLKRRLIAAWSGLQQHLIDDEAIDQWRGRLRACVRADGDTSNTSLDTLNRFFYRITVNVA